MLHIAVSGFNLQWFQKSLQSLRKIELSSTANVTDGAILNLFKQNQNLG